MKTQIKQCRVITNLLVGIVIGCVISTSTIVYGADTFQSIQVVFNKVNLSVNGQNVTTDNILYNGTTYVPIRAVANTLGKEVGWDSSTNTASINDADYIEPIKGEDMIVQNEFIQGNGIIAGDGYIIIKGTNETLYTSGHVLELINAFGSYELDGDKFMKENVITFNFLNDHSTLIDNVPYRKINNRTYIDKQYYEQNILPLVQ